MASNFDFLKENWSFLQDDALKVEASALRDPRTAAFYARRTLERALTWLFENDTALKAPYEKSLAAMIHEPTFKNNIKPGLFQDIRYIQKLGNLAVHADQDISNKEGMQACGAVFRFTGWLARVYTRGGAAPGNFEITLLPKDDSNEATVIELQRVRELLEQKEKAEKAEQAKHKQTADEKAELEKKLAELQAIKKENTKRIPEKDYSESETRDFFIDIMLREAGWNPKGENVEEYEVQGMPSDSGEGKVDYVLWGSDGLPLAVVEAKKTKIDPRQGKQQAKLYADCLETQFSRRPVIFYTNGYSTWIWDDSEYPPRTIEGFYTRDQLQWLINRRPDNDKTGKQDLTTLKPNPEIIERYYQQDASARVMEEFHTKKRRKSLIVMATGTGKTRLAISIVELLNRGNWARRVLFLADRIALVKQAKGAFKSHLKDYSVKSLVDRDKEDASLNDARVVFSTYPTMLNLIDGTKKDKTDAFGVGHFDLIIIDEAHRSVYQKYGAIFQYFDSLLIGLTATPRDEIDRNTYKLFELENGQPTYSYELSVAVEDGFLTPPRALSVPLKFPREGIKYSELSEEEQEEYELQEQFHDDETGELIEEVNAGAINQWLFNQDTVDKVLMHLMESGLKVEGGDKLGKTIIFAKNTKHADFIVQRFDANYPAYAGKFCQKIDFSVNYAQSLIDDFSVVSKMPQIAVSVDMLDTGIDVPEILNLVFFKIVRSRTKFWQMIGRGTRLCEDLFGPGQDKKEFIVFDYLQNLEYFESNPGGYEPKLQPSVKQKIFHRRLELAHSLQEGNPDDELLSAFGEELKDEMHAIVQSFNAENFIVRKQYETVQQFEKRERWAKLSEEDVESIKEKLTDLPWDDEDEETARRFDLLIYNLQIAVLRELKSQVDYQKRVRRIASILEEKASIPMVAAQMELLQEIQRDDWWQDVTLPMLETVRKKVRGLIKFIEKSNQEDIYTDFEDELDTSGVVERTIVRSDPSLKDYRERVERIIRENKDHLTIRRLRNNEPISQTDIESLEKILFDEAELSEADYEKLTSTRPIGVLARSIVGLNRNAAKQAFGEFMQNVKLHPDQIAFINEIIEYLVKNGTLEPKQLFDSPFTRLNERGVSGAMGDDLAGTVVELVRQINRNAEVA